MLDITSIGASGNFSQTDNCGRTLAPKASCSIQVTFTPTTIGSLSGTLSITDNAPLSPQTISLAGTGTVVELNPSSLAFVERGEQQQTMLTNAGASALSIDSIKITGSGSASFSQTNTCGSQVAAGVSCTITVTFSPYQIGGAT